MDSRIREPDQIRQDTAHKLRSISVSEHFQAVLGCLLDEDWTTPRLVEMVITPDGHLIGRCQDQASFSAFLGASEDLLRNIHGIAPVAELDGDEVGYLLTKSDTCWARLRKSKGGGWIECRVVVGKRQSIRDFDYSG